MSLLSTIPMSLNVPDIFIVSWYVHETLDKDRGARHAAVHGVAKSQTHDLAPERQQHGMSSTNELGNA